MDECRILDNLPAAMVKYREEAGASIKMYEMGFPIGFRAQTEVCSLKHVVTDTAGCNRARFGPFAVARV